MEEIARIYGYDNIPSTIPQTNDRGYLTPKQEYLRGIRKVLEGLGLRESNQYEDLADLRAKLVQVLIDRKGDEK